MPQTFSMRNDLTDVVRQFLTEQFPNVPTELVEISSPPKPELGDFSVPCFRFAKPAGMSPVEFAAGLAGFLIDVDFILSAKAQGPYVNVAVDRARYFPEVVGRVLGDGDAYGTATRGEGQTIVIDFSHPNIAKPFHVGHLRSTNLGAIISRLFASQGFHVHRKNYLGDWGTQFGFVIYGWQQYGDETELQNDAIQHLVALYIRANQDAETDETVREQARDIFRRLEQGDAEIAKLWTRFRDVSITAFQKTYQRLGVSFDSYDGEAAIGPKVDGVVERFMNAGIAYESDGAIVVDVESGKKELPPCMLRKSDGSSTYAARDCAEAIGRYEEHSFESNLYVVSRQDDHFAQVFGALSRLAEVEQWDDDWTKRCEVISFGFVKGMSTRKGQVVWLDDLLNEAAARAGEIRREKAAVLDGETSDGETGDENGAVEGAVESETLFASVDEAVAQAAILFSDVSAKRLRDVDFSWETALRFEGYTGPYIQYTFARTAALIEKAAGQGIVVDPSANLAAEQLTLETIADAEWQLVAELDTFPRILEMATESREPHEVAKYLYEIANRFNTFYAKCRVVDADDLPTTQRRIFIAYAVQQLLKNGLALLGIRPLPKM